MGAFSSMSQQVVNLVLDSIVLCNANDKEEYRTHLNMYQYLRYHRTVALNLPRCVGKTTAIKTLAASNSALVVNRYAVAGNTVEYLTHKFLGYRNTLNLKYSMLLADEILDFDQLYPLILMLAKGNLLTSDFTIVMLGTK